jgi:hypothetical protein
MKRSHWILASLPVVIAVAFTVACAWTKAEILTYDPMAPSVSKGYVEFSSPAGQSGVSYYTYSIHEQKNGQEVDAFPLQIWSGTQKRRIAEPPGTHTFVVKPGNVSEALTAEVLEGMVTPVAVFVKDVGQGATIGATTTYGFRLVTAVGSPVPYYAGAEYKRGGARR